MFGVKLEAFKAGFFDRDKVIAAMNRKTRKVLSKFGSYVWKRARTSIKKAPKVNAETGVRLGRGRRRKDVPVRDAVSRPGDPPFGHGDQLLRKNIFFAYDDSAKSVIIGPAKLNKPGSAPSALEYGGLSQAQLRSGAVLQIKIEPRPFMGPAFLEEQKSSLPKLWADLPFK